MIRAWSMASLGHVGAYVESLGMLGPLQELMLQSWDEVVRIFPLWKADINASYTNLRAEGAFLVSASWQDGAVHSATLHSERGGRCRLEWPWTGPPAIECSNGESVAVTAEDHGVISFDTKPGLTYQLKKA